MRVKINYGGKLTTLETEFSKKGKITELKNEINRVFGVDRGSQRLLHRGKELKDGFELYDYQFQTGDTVILAIRQQQQQHKEEEEEEKTRRVLKEKDNNAENSTKSSSSSEKEEEDKEGKVSRRGSSRASRSSLWYEIGDNVDIIEDNGEWYEGNIKGIYEMTPQDSFISEDSLAYQIVYSEDLESETQYFKGLGSIRPRCHRKMKAEDLKVGDEVMGTYNEEYKKKRGGWHTLKIEEEFVQGGGGGGVRSRKSLPFILATVYLSPDKEDGAKYKGSKIIFLEELYIIEEPVKISERENKIYEIDDRRIQAPSCFKCDDEPEKYCKDCCCTQCRQKDRQEVLLICEDCHASTHTHCLDPPLDAIPEDDWYCPDCRLNPDDIVGADANPLSHRKTKNVPAYNPKSKRDWGKGMATAGRTKTCTKVKDHHFGPIPGIDVGQMYVYRIQLSEEGIHRPPVAGISGSVKYGGANSIVLAGGYDEDEDNGDEFWYTGSGGRDLSGNKRTAEQSFDQSLDKTNLAIATSCAAPINNKVGNDAGDNWKKGKPVRVVRSFKFKKHSKYAPDEGLRYDGIYKVVQYEFVKGKSGFRVWRFLFRRDDTSPAPWTKEGKRFIEENGITMIYPEGYDPNKKKDKKNSGGTNKRKSEVLTTNNDDEFNDDENENPEKPSKQPKLAFIYKIDQKTLDLIDKDVKNKSLWKSVKEIGNFANRKAFIDEVAKHLECVICMELIMPPITTPCSHNFCQSCVNRAYEAHDKKDPICPHCRKPFGEKSDLQVNQQMKDIIMLLFPGYE